MPKRSFQLDEDALREALDGMLGRATPRRDLWAGIQAATHSSPPRSRKWAALAAAPVVLAALAAIALLGTRLMNGGPSAEAVYVTEALGSLFKVSSVYVHQETRSDNLVTSMFLDGLPQSQGSLPSLPPLEYTDCALEAEVRRCTLVDKTSGERIGRSASTGGKRTVEGYYMFPSRFFVRTAQVLDAELWPDSRGSRRPDGKTSIEEFLYVDGRAYTRSDVILGDNWMTMPPGSARSRPTTPDKLFWGLFENRLEGAPDILRRQFGAVEQLEENEVDRVPTRRYRASASCGEGCWQVLDIWIGIQDSLPRKAVAEIHGKTAERAGSAPERTETFTFSRFNETLKLPPEPRPEEVRRFPRLTEAP